MQKYPPCSFHMKHCVVFRTSINIFYFILEQFPPFLKYTGQSKILSQLKRGITHCPVCINNTNDHILGFLCHFKHFKWGFLYFRIPKLGCSVQGTLYSINIYLVVPSPKIYNCHAFYFTCSFFLSNTERHLLLDEYPSTQSIKRCNVHI